MEELELNLSPEYDNSHNCSFATGVIRKYIQKNNILKVIWVVSCPDGLVLLHLHKEDMTQSYYISNHVLPQWVQLSSPPYLPDQYHRCAYSGLVTRWHPLGLQGVVHMFIGNLMFFSPTWTFHIYLSDTSEWCVQQVSFPGHCVSHNTFNHVSLDGKLHLLDEFRRRIIVHDFFSHDIQVQTICLLPAEWALIMMAMGTKNI